MNKNKKLSEIQLKLAESLTSLQRNFVINVVSGMTRRQAYIKAGGTAKKSESQDSAASNLFSNMKVRAFYDSLMNEAQSNAVMTKEQALIRLTQSANVTMKDVCDFKDVQIGEDKNGDPVYQTVWTFKNSEDIPPHIAACIKSVAVTREGPKIELYDSQSAIKQLGGMLGWEMPVKATATPVKFDFDDNASLSAQAAQIVREASNGNIPPDVALMFINSIAAIIKIDEVTELNFRLDEIEKIMDLSNG